MASVDAGSTMQSAIQAIVQPKLMENGWVPEENDTTLSEYVTMMIVNGKDLPGVQAELGNDLLGVGEDDPTVGEFARWLFDKVNELSAPSAPQQQQEGAGSQSQQQIPTGSDAQMDDAATTADAPPKGPRSMRNNNAQRGGRGNRMLNQVNRSLDRSSELPDGLRRIKGAAGGQSGRINAHANRDGPPRGPKNNIANGMQRMMNGGRGGHQANLNPVQNMLNGGGQFNPQQQMQFMQMMEASAQMMAQVLQQNTGVGMGNAQRGNQRGPNRPGQKRPQNNKLHAVDGKLPDGPLPGSAADSGMDIDKQEAKSDKFSTVCRFNLSCTNPSCEFAHQSPAAPPNTSVDVSDTCSHGASCTNFKCTGRHPSPAQRSSHKQEVDCKFYPNCTNPSCPFRHPAAKPCRNGADCTVPNCSFAHSTILCRYNPCLNPSCPFKHGDGQKRGKFEDKVWTANGGENGGGDGGKAERFADFSKQSEGQEELIIPGQTSSAEPQQDGSNPQSMDTQIAT